MRKASAIQQETQSITTVEDLTGVFESIASTQVAKSKGKVELSKEFFDLLWARYSAIRVDPKSRITNREAEAGDRNAFIVIAAEAGLSGDIDDRLLEAVIQDYDISNTDIMVIGTHGATLLKDRGIHYMRFFKVPESEAYVDVSPIMDAIDDYAQVTVYYEEYVSLGVQGIKKLNLVSTIQAMSADSDSVDIISPKETIFEPSLDDIADIMERGMKSLALSQAILESGLAQSASRFNAMASAKKRAFELIGLYNLEFHRAKRSENDRRLREILIGIKKKKAKRTRLHQ